MANSKISELPDAVQPLKGTDVLPIVQKTNAGVMVTNKVSVNNLLAAGGGSNLPGIESTCHSNGTTLLMNGGYSLYVDILNFKGSQFNLSEAGSSLNANFFANNFGIEANNFNVDFQIRFSLADFIKTIA